MENIIVHSDPWSGLWAVGFLFTLGYLRLGLGKSLLAIIIWPFFLGISLRTGDRKI